MGAWDYDGAALTGATATLSQVVEGGREAFKKMRIFLIGFEGFPYTGGSRNRDSVGPLFIAGKHGRMCLSQEHFYSYSKLANERLNPGRKGQKRG